MSRVEYIFRGAVEPLQKVMIWGVDPLAEIREKLKLPLAFPGSSFSLLKNSLNARPKMIRIGPVMRNETALDRLPQLFSWPYGGGPFITLPQVYTENPDIPGVMHSNLGMYRVQITGNKYKQNEETGLHYQIHRGTAAHHLASIRLNRLLPCSENSYTNCPAYDPFEPWTKPEYIRLLIRCSALGNYRLQNTCFSQRV